MVSVMLIDADQAVVISLQALAFYAYEAIDWVSALRHWSSNRTCSSCCLTMLRLPSSAHRTACCDPLPVAQDIGLMFQFYTHCCRELPHN
jgi:hypothetical protein